MNRVCYRQTAGLMIGVLTFMHAFTFSAAQAAAAQAAVKPVTPNIIIILADDMGYGDASCFGNTSYKTPNIDRLAASGVRFTDFHSSGPVCSPTRAGLLTGRYQQRAGIPGVVFADPNQNRHHGLHEQEVTFADLLHAAGYKTGIFGKWHLGYQKQFNPVHHGFDRFRGYVSGNVDYVLHCDRIGIADWWEGDKLVPEDGYVTHLISKHAIEFMRRHHKEPFCLYVAHETPHSPYQGPHDGPVRAIGQGDLKGAGRKDIANAYREMMTEMDRGVGEILDAVKQLEIAENTLVFFFSDNGANQNGSNGNLRGFKGSLWEGGHRVPAAAIWPGRIPPGTVCHEPAISIDVMPTMLAAAGVTPPSGHHLDGVSLLPIMTQGKSLPQRTLFWDYRTSSAVRRGPWKLLLTGQRRQTVGLYNLADDIGEETNLAEQHPGRVAELRAALTAWQTDVADGATVQPEMKN